MVETARALARRPGSTTRPSSDRRDGALRRSAALTGCSTSGSALSFAQVLRPGLRRDERAALRVGRGAQESARRGVFEVEACVIELASRLPSVGTTIFTVMSRLAADVGAINLSQGFPDFDCDPALVEAVARHMRAGRNQYAPMQGVPALREAIAANVSRHSTARRYDPDNGGDGHFRRHWRRSSTRSPLSCIPATRSSSSSRATTRACPAIELSGGIAGRASRCAYPDYAVDWDAVRACDHAEDAAADDQHAAQSDGRRSSPPTTSRR